MPKTQKHIPPVEKTSIAIKKSTARALKTLATMSDITICELIENLIAKGTDRKILLAVAPGLAGKQKGATS